MKTISAVAGLVMAAGLAAPASAQQILASNPQSLMDFFFNQGVPAQLKVDNVGDPLVEFRVNSDTMQVYFYDCSDNANCRALQFYAGYRTEGSTDLSVANDWNAERRFVRAYLTDNNALRIEMDMATGDGGISESDFAELYALWLESVTLFEERIGW